MNDGLKDEHRIAIIKILLAHPKVLKAVLFGSRAMGTFSIGSDVDFAIYGTELTLDEVMKLSSKISDIPMAQTVDLHCYHHIVNINLKEHIDNLGIVWFDKDCQT